MTPTEILRVTAHRPFPLPRGPWLINMTWRDLLFAHWPMPAAVVRAVLPAPLELETCDGSAWVGVIPFVMDLSLRGVPVLVRTPELNVRTYVSYRGIPGVYFFSLDLASTIGVLGARIGVGLPYWLAEMWARRVPLPDGDHGLPHAGPVTAGESREQYEVRYGSARVAARADFWGCYRPAGAVLSPQPGTIEHFVAERYCLYNVERGKVYRVTIHHVPWPLQPAEAEIARNTMAAANGISLPPGEPLLHFARELEVLCWAPERARLIT
jgi:uncharacterized protein YqjF (DUF2071 family)